MKLSIPNKKDFISNVLNPVSNLNDKTIIKDLKKDLRTQKIKTAVAFIGAGITTITTIFLLVK